MKKDNTFREGEFSNGFLKLLDDVFINYVGRKWL